MSILLARRDLWPHPFWMHRALSFVIGISSVFIPPAAIVRAEQPRQLELPGNPTHSLPRWPAQDEHLVLSTSENQARLFIRKAPPITSAPNLPLLKDLRDMADLVPFGESERCETRRSASDIIVTCAAGTGPAGILLTFDGKLPPGAAVEADVGTDGSGGFRFQIVNAGDDATASVPASGRQNLRLPTRTDAPIQLVVLAPAAGGSIRLTDLRLVPTRTARAIDAAAWVWEPQAWKEGGGALIFRAAERGVRHLYITLMIEDGKVRHQADLARFIRNATSAKIAVEAVEGDPHIVIREGLANALARAMAISRYQQDAPVDARLAGIQYDIEPYVLPDWGTPSVDHGAWSDAVNALAQTLGGPIHIVLPFWVANEPAGAQFLRDLGGSVSAVTIMSYRTDSALAAALAEPLLHWGAMAGKPVRIALEAGPVVTEAEEAFVPAPSGRLALTEKKGQVTATLFSESTVVAGAKMYASRGVVETRSDRISFLGQEQRMVDAAEEVARVASAWDSFAGIGFHGLSWPKR